ncbi:hypothetical protein HY991_05300 [Candidatus Micrarchaeota archaeon]|nr:hypothetical protein [Candidatus Micrarchaeota archaeon]
MLDYFLKKELIVKSHIRALEVILHSKDGSAAAEDIRWGAGADEGIIQDLMNRGLVEEFLDGNSTRYRLHPVNAFEVVRFFKKRDAKNKY